MHEDYEVSRLLEGEVRPGDETAVAGLFTRLHIHESYLPIFTLEDIKTHARDNKFFVARERATGEIVGMATLVVSTFFGRKKGAVEEVVVSEEHERRGNATRIMEALVAAASGGRLIFMHLTSSDERPTAQALYRRMGFKEKSATRPFIMML